MLILLTVSLLASIDGIWWVMYSYPLYIQNKINRDRELIQSLHYDADDCYARLLSFIVENKNELCASDCLPTLLSLEKKASEMSLPISPNSEWVQDQFLESVILWSRKKSPRDRGFMRSLHRHAIVYMHSDSEKNEIFILLLKKYFKRECYFMQKVARYKGKTARIFYNLSAHRAYELIHLIKIRSLKNEFLPIFITALPSATEGILFAR